jgi:hypothetical protein
MGPLKTFDAAVNSGGGGGGRGADRKITLFCKDPAGKGNLCSIDKTKRSDGGRMVKESEQNLLLSKNKLNQTCQVDQLGKNAIDRGSSSVNHLRKVLSSEKLEKPKKSPTKPKLLKILDLENRTTRQDNLKKPKKPTLLPKKHPQKNHLFLQTTPNNNSSSSYETNTFIKTALSQKPAQSLYDNDMDRLFQEIQDRDRDQQRSSNKSILCQIQKQLIIANSIEHNFANPLLRKTITSTPIDANSTVRNNSLVIDSQNGDDGSMTANVYRENCVGM